jgi:adenylate kinase
MACTLLSRGQLLPDEVTNEIVAGRIGQADCANGFLLDGYPRTVPQARHFSQLLQERGLPEPIVIHLDVRDDDLIARLTARRQCPQCKHIYNLLSQPPRVAGICDKDGSALMEREDDREGVIAERLRAYQELTGPILQFYGESVVRRIDGSAASDQVKRAIESAIPSEKKRPVLLSA